MDDSDGSQAASPAPKKRTLKTAYHILRKEALRRFREAHKNDPAYERRLSSVSLHEPSDDNEIEQFIDEYERSRSVSQNNDHANDQILEDMEESDQDDMVVFGANEDSGVNTEDQHVLEVNDLNEESLEVIPESEIDLASAESMQPEIPTEQIVAPVFELVFDEEPDNDIVVDVPDISLQNRISKSLPSSGLFKFHDSFGYDSHKRINLHIFPEQRALFSAGTLLVFRQLNPKIVENKEQIIRSPTGTVGSIAVHKTYRYFAVGGKGDKPSICIFEYPSLETKYVLHGGALQSYAHLEFSPDGILLASLSGNPDYMLTLWNWKKQAIVLRSKAFSLDVFRVSFSSDIDGQLTSGGIGHIRFWNMANTFTGLKLQGQIGRFGRTSVSDVEAFVQLPDGKVVSGCEWGNMLVWEGGLIKVEISRKDGKPCHESNIKQLTISEGELMSIGTDGFIHVWDLENIDQVECDNDQSVYEMEPMNTLKIPNAEITSLTMSPDKDTIWYAQDRRGAIWELDLSFGHTTAQPKKLVGYHGMPVVGISAAPGGHVVASTGDNELRITDIAQRSFICKYDFTVSGTALTWLKGEESSLCILVGFIDGTLRLMSYGKQTANLKSCLIMLQALRPHGSQVTTIQESPDKSLVATGSIDETIFIYKVQASSIVPMGFVTATGPLINLVWRDNTTILSTCHNHTVCQIKLPPSEMIDNTHSFKLENSSIKISKFKSCKSNLKREKAVLKFKEHQTVVKARCEKKLAEAKKAAKTLGESLSSEEINTILAPGNQLEFEELDEYSFVPEEEANATWVRPAPAEDEYYCQMSDFDAGMIYKCKLYDITEVTMEPVEPIDAFELDDEEPISSWVEQDQRIFAGYTNGRVRVFHLEEATYDEDMLRKGLTDHHTLEMHDNMVGAVINLVTTQDGHFLISCGNDGNIFSYELVPPKEIQLTELTPAAVEGADLTDDIKGTYSLEEDKQKSEMDRKIREANLLKDKKRRQIKDLIRVYERIKTKNIQLPEACRLGPDELELSAKLKTEAEEMLKKKIEQIKLENQWGLEKCKLQVQKVQDRFRGHIEEDSLMLYAIETDHKVKRYEIEKLSEEVKIEIDRDNSTLKSRDGTRGGKSKSGKREGDDHSTSTENKDGLKNAAAESMTKLSRAQRKAEEKKRRKEQREKEWEKLLKARPDERYSNPQDEEEIRVARASLGIFQLKTSPDYVVPESLRSNTKLKRHQIAITLLEIYDQKKIFNDKFNRARREKTIIKNAIIKLTKDLEKVQKGLPKSEHRSPPAIPEILDDENCPFGNAHIKATNNGIQRTDIIEPRKSARDSAMSLGLPSATNIFDRETKHESTVPDDGLSKFEVFEQKKKIILLRHKRDKLIDGAKKRIEKFDQDVKSLYLYKLKLDEDITLSQLSLDTLKQELIILKDFEAREDIILDRCNSKENELEDVKQKVHSSKTKLDSKQKELGKLLEREKTVQSEFQSLIGENNKFNDYLTKVFKKKIKRITQTSNANSDESSDDESSDDDSDWSDEDSDAEPFDDTVCPTGCSSDLFDETLELRGRRCEIEDEMQDTKKLADSLRKDNDALNKKVKILQTQLQGYLTELEVFQIEKQGKLNEIWVVVPMLMNQIQFPDFSEPEEIPFDGGLVVPKDTISRLNTRIEELMVEREEEKVKFRNARHQHVLLTKGNKEKVAKVTELTEKCNQAMMLKFGRVVDIDGLGTVTVSRAVEEAREGVRQNEIQIARVEHAMEQKIQKLKKDLSGVINENTHRLNMLAEMTSESDQLQQLLDEYQTDTAPDELQEKRKKDTDERQKLRNAVSQQADEIQSLKDEIIRLTRKGGHMLPPAQANHADHGDH